MNQLTVSHLCLGYDGQELVSDLNFSVSSGDYLGIIGENGSGKSTLLRTLLHLNTPLSGEIRFGPGLSSHDIGYLPQQTPIQRDFPASVKEIVLSGCLGHKRFRLGYSGEEKELAAKNLSRMGLTDLASRCYRELSGGQQQRVLLARALCATQKLLLLDEPVTGLDPKGTEELYHIIRDLNQKEHITILMISHDVPGVLAYASHILQIGDSLFFGTKAAYLQWRRETSLSGKEEAYV